MSELENLYRWFCDLFQMSIAKNEHLRLPMFHNFLGCFIENEFYFGNVTVDTRIHNFNLQESGTGKGVAQELNRKLLRECGKDTRITQQFTSAGVIGTVTFNNAGEMISDNRPLEDLDWLCVDEGSFFMGNPNQHVMDFIKCINRYLDSGEVCKMLAHGPLEYKGRAALCMGSFVDDTVKSTFLHTGFFQRFWDTYKHYNDSEAAAIRKEMDNLAIKSDEKEEKWEEHIEKIKKSVSEIRQFNSRVYSFTPENAKYYGDKFEELVNSKQEQVEQLTTSLRNVFRTSLTRAKKLGYKVIVHYCTVNKLEEVSTDAINYALKCVDAHVNSFLNMLIDNFNTEMEVEAAPIMVRKKEEARQKIMQIAKEKKAFTRIEFFNELKGRYAFELGIGGCDKILDKLVAEGKLQMTRGEKNAKIYSLNEVV